MPFDPSNVTVEDSEIAPRSRADSRDKYSNNPFVEPLRESYSAGYYNERGKWVTGKAKSATVLGSDAAEVERWIRQAAKTLFNEGIGARIQFTWDGGGPTASVKEVPADDTPVTVKVEGRPARGTNK